MILNNCRVCKSTKLKSVISLLNQPLANNLCDKPNEKIKLYPLDLMRCERCYNCQLSIAVDNKKLFSKYFYKSSISYDLKKHFDNACKKYIKKFNFKKNSYIMDIGSNDGVGLIPFKKRKYLNLFGVEPAANLCNLTRNLKIKTYNSFLNSKIAKKNLKKFDLITASNVFAHVNNIHSLTKNIFSILKDDGVFILEVQYLLNMVKDGSFDNIYHEHVNYWSLTTLVYFFKKINATVFDVEIIETHGGSIRVYVKNDFNNKYKIERNVKSILNKEAINNIDNIKFFKRFKYKIKNRKISIKKILLSYQRKNKTIVGYGAPAKATTLINYFNIKKYISYIIDDNDLKNKKFIPNTSIQILSNPKNSKIDLILVFAWNYFKLIKKNNKKLSKKFISIF